MPTEPTPATQEQQRQQWLHSLGLTPWVATACLPGAAPSRWLELPESARDSITQTSTLEAPSVVVRSAQPQPAPTHSPRPTVTQRTPSESPQAEKTPPAEKMPRLHICQVAHTLLIVEQQDRQAPELGRDEQQLLQNLMQVFGTQSRRYPFICPTRPQEAHEALIAFAKGLATQGCQRILLCLSESACQQLLADQVRLQAFTLADLPALVLYSLDELLAEPLVRKRQSWQLLCEAGFVV